MHDYLPVPGTKLEELDTPALLIDLPIFEKNMKLVADFYREREARCDPISRATSAPKSLTCKFKRDQPLAASVPPSWARLRQW